MWVKVDDKFPEHPKVVAAGARLGRYGCGRVLAIWLAASSWTNRHETDGVIPLTVFREMFRLYDRAPLQVAAAMAEPVVIAGEARSGLFEALAAGAGYRLHDHGEYQPTRAKQEAKREETRLRVQNWRARQAADRAAPTGNASCNSVTGGGVTQDVTLLVTPPPDPDPIPNPNPKSADARARGIAYRGSALTLTTGQHAYLVRMLNGVALDLVGEVYPRWDRELAESGEPFDALDWCTARLKAEVGIRRPATPTEADYREAERIFRHVTRGCTHEPTCPDRESCVAKLALRVMVHRISPGLAVRA